MKIDNGRGLADLLNLILEVSGQKKKEKEATVRTAKATWVPGFNNLGTFGRWAFLEIDGSNPHKTCLAVNNCIVFSACLNIVRSTDFRAELSIAHQLPRNWG